MAKIGHGYGSEWHLLRYMGRHRREFDTRILKEVGEGSRIDWLDFGYAQRMGKPRADKEITGIDFLTDPAYSRVLQAWTQFWPATGTPITWDAVGWLSGGENPEILLLEAKAHLAELRSSSKASSAKSMKMIASALAQTKAGIGVVSSADWTKEYYQAANRLAVLWFLNTHGVPARLIGVYFLNDKHINVQCPTSQAWQQELALQDGYLGTDQGHALANRVHRVFIDLA